MREPTPKLDKPWKDHIYLYLSCCTNNHWFALYIDLEERTIFMFDNLKRQIRRQLWKAHILSQHEDSFAVKIPCHKQGQI